MAFFFDGLHFDWKSMLYFSTMSSVVTSVLYKRKITNWIIVVGSCLLIGHFVSAILSPNYRQLLHAQKNRHFRFSQLNRQDRMIRICYHIPFLIGFTIIRKCLVLKCGPQTLLHYFFWSHISLSVFFKEDMKNGRENLNVLTNVTEPLQAISNALEKDTIEHYLETNEIRGTYRLEAIVKRVKRVLRKERTIKMTHIVRELQILPNDIQTRILDIYILADCDDDRAQIQQTIQYYLENF